MEHVCNAWWNQALAWRDFFLNMCISPIDAFYGERNPETGKRRVVFKRDQATADLVNNWVTIPCGRCRECKIRKKREWALRCEHEASLHLENTWLYLSYDDKHLPHRGSLCKPDLQKFLKDLRAWESYEANVCRCGSRPQCFLGECPRRRNNYRHFKFFACGEYGPSDGRPHYHVLLFGFAFPDQVRFAERDGKTVYNSDLLENRLWKKGFTEIGDVNFDSIAYCAKYVAKKDDRIDDAYRVAGYEPEFVNMSRRPGIGRRWFEQYGEEALRNDSVLLKGREVNVPRYYDALYEVQEPEKIKAIKKERASRFDSDEMRSTRLLSRKKIVESKYHLFHGGA